jgi:hypothetical protein
MSRTLAPILLTLLAAPLGMHADGCKYALNGRFVPEREQRALIEWADGTETLYVAALSDATSEGSVWVVPVRAPANGVRAEPVDEFPVVGFYQTLKSRAREPLDNWLAATAVLDSGGLVCPCFAGFVGGCDDKKSTGSAKEVSRVEKLGMVVTVVSAESRPALEEYLGAQGIDRRAADLAPLEPYFGKSEYAFVCAWVARTGGPAAATGLKLAFPSPTLWFPLRPTRAYASAVDTVVYTRGFVKPVDGCDLPDLRCEYVYGLVEPQGVYRAFTGAHRADRHRHYSGASEPLTRITLTSDPRQWDRDLELVPGTTAVGSANLALTGWVLDVGLGWSAILGALLGLFLPRLTIPRAERHWADYFGGTVTGAAILFTIWASMLAFAIWRSVRFREGMGPPKRYLAVIGLAFVHFLFVLAIYGVLVACFVREN